MITIDYEKLTTDMLNAANGVLKKQWEDVGPYAQKEFTSFTENIKLIESLKLVDRITEEQAKLYMEIQESSLKTVFLTIEGLGTVAVESAINAAIAVVRATVNTAIGWRIL